MCLMLTGALFEFNYQSKVFKHLFPFDQNQTFDI